MGRKRKIENDDLVRLIYEYHFTYPEEKIKIPAVGEYIRSKEGYENVTDINIRRNELAREHINQINNCDEEKKYKIVISFKPLDVDYFIRNNHKREKLKKSLLDLDSYYSSIADSAIYFKKEYEKIADSNRKLKEKLLLLNERIEKNKALKQRAKENDELIEYLKNIVEVYVKPGIANTLLRKKGVFESDEPLIKKDIRTELITADTNVQKFNSESLNTLLEDFDD